MIATDVAISYIQSCCPSSPEGYFYFPISEEESLAVPVASLEMHPYCKEHKELLASLSRIRMHHHAPFAGKTWVFFDGMLASIPDRRYAIAITNVNEYTVHVYKKSTDEHMFHSTIAAAP